MTKEYFTDRQDRYMLVSNCKPMADFCEGLVEKLCSVSLRLTQDNSLEPPKHLHPYLSPKDLYVKYACNVVWGYYQQALKRSKKTLNPGTLQKQDTSRVSAQMSQHFSSLNILGTFKSLKLAVRRLKISL